MENYVGEIRMFAGNYAPQNWLICDGSALQISTNEVLYTLLGTTYGGDGVTTFKLPDLRGRVPIHQGTGIGLTNRILGQAAGTEDVTLTLSNMPAHSHAAMAVAVAGTTDTPSNAVMLSDVSSKGYATNAATPPAVLPTAIAMSASSFTAAPGSFPTVSIVQPFTAVSFIIATVGIYPSQS